MNEKAKYILIATIFILLFVIAGLAYYSLSSNYDVEIPDVEDMEKSKDFSVTDENGNNVKLSDYYGKPVIVNFWATWCGPCRSEFPVMEKMYKKYGNEVEFMIVNMTDGYRDTVESAKSFVVDNGYTFPVYFDTKSEAVNAYSINAVPVTLFIDRDGYVTVKYTGAISENTMEKYIKQIIGDEK